MRIVIGEDITQITSQLKEIIHSFNCEVVGVGHSKTKILKLIKKLKPDLVLIDVLLEKQYIGIDIGNYLTHQLHMPFIYLIAPSDKEVMDKILHTKPNGYILKPFKAMEVLIAIQIAITNYKAKTRTNFIILKKEGFKFKLDLSEILFIKAYDNYIKIYTKGKKYIQRLCLKKLFKEIASKGFIRVHRCYVVNKHHIRKLSHHEAQIDKYKIPISRTYLKKLKKVVISHSFENFIFSLFLLSL